MSVVWDFSGDYCNLLTFTVDYCNLLTHKSKLDKNDCLSVEEIARYLEKKKSKNVAEEQTAKQNQSVRTRSMSSKRDSENKKKTKRLFKT